MMKYRFGLSVYKRVKIFLALTFVASVLILVEPYYFGMAIVCGAYLLWFIYLRFFRGVNPYKRIRVCVEFCEKYQSGGTWEVEDRTSGFGTLEGLLYEMRLSISSEGFAVTFVNASVECDGFIRWDEVQQLNETELIRDGKKYQVAELYLKECSEDVVIPWDIDFRAWVPETVGLSSV